MNGSESEEMAAKAITERQSIPEVRSLRKQVLSVFLVSLTAVCLWSCRLTLKFEQIFHDMVGDRPLPEISRWAVALGQSTATYLMIIGVSVSSIACLWRDREGNKAPQLAALCLCAVLFLFCFLMVTALVLPMADIVTLMQED